MDNEEERINGKWTDEDGEEIDVRLKPEWRGHKWTSLEARDLFNGMGVEVTLTSKAGKPYKMLAKLAHQSFTNSEGKVIKGVWVTGEFPPRDSIPDEWCKHKFTDKEKEILKNGQKVHADDFVSKKGNKFSCDVTFGQHEWQGKQVMGIIAHFDNN